MLVTSDQIFALTKHEYSSHISDLLNHLFPKYDIITPLRVQHFLSQTIHESGGFKIIRENLNYSQQGLRSVFPKYFPDDNIAFRYARQPQAIANRVYAGRYGNGGESSGDGWKYRGFGFIQLTFKDNHLACSLDLFGDDRMLNKLDETLEMALMSSLWFWKKNYLNLISDKDDVLMLTKKINGGKNGLAERTSLLNKAKGIIHDS